MMAERGHGRIVTTREARAAIAPFQEMRGARAMALLSRLASLVRRRAEPIAWMLAALYALALAYPTHLRVVGAYWTETDFYIFWAPDADRIAAGEFPQHPNNPPAYSILLAFLSRWSGDHFVSGKWLSLVTGALTGVLAF